MSGGRTQQKISMGTSLVIFYFRLRAAFVLWHQRKRAGLGIQVAASAINVDWRILRQYELGRKSPPLTVIHALLTHYRADEFAVLFFCTIPLPAPGLGWWFRRIIRGGLRIGSRTRYPIELSSLTSELA
jgi:hypothetical protein